MHAVFLHGSTDVACGAAERGTVAMAVDIHAEGLLLVPAALAIWFMLWALWHWRKEEKRQRFTDGLNPRARLDPSNATRDDRR